MVVKGGGCVPFTTWQFKAYETVNKTRARTETTGSVSEISVGFGLFTYHLQPRRFWSF